MKRLISVLVAVVLLSFIPAHAEYSVEERGSWPESWPDELDELRQQSRTYEGPLAPLKHYAIPFTDREAFEAAWPHLLKMKSQGAPIILKRGPVFWFDDDTTAGVCVHTPPDGEAPVEDLQKIRGHLERTIYIEVLVDGEIIDLNRIPLPRDTPIIDERFKDSSNSP